MLGLTLVALAGAFAVAGQANGSPRSGAFHATKECSQYTGQAGDHCTITSSTLRGIDVGSRIIYADARGGALLDTDIVLFTGPGNAAFGHVTIDLATRSGVVTLSGGTGQFLGFRASAVVTFDAATKLFHWDGTYSFDPPGGGRSD